MASAILNVSGRDRASQVELDPRGTVIGRSSYSDVVLEGKNVSRNHAIIFEDPFGRWIVEDLGSSNGTFINGKRVEASAVMPGDSIVIGPFVLSITQSFEQEIGPDESIEETNVILDDFETEIFYGQTGADAASSYPYPDKLIEINRRLSELTSPSALYIEVCRYLAQQQGTVALVLRLPTRDEALPRSPGVLACRFADSPDDTSAPDVRGLYPSLPVILNQVAFRVSRRVVREVLSQGSATMAKSIRSSDEEITSTFIDEHSPRALICVPLGVVADRTDVLYVDVPIDRSKISESEKTFVFVRGLAKEIISARERLFLMQAKAERSGLNHELSLARRVQSGLRPVVPDGLKGVQAAVHFRPVLWVGGDYCDVWTLDDGRLAFVVGEVSSMGLPAAIALSDCRMLLRNTMSFYKDLPSVIGHVNLQLVRSVHREMPATLFAGLFDPSEGTLEYVNAGYLQPLLVRPPSTVLPFGSPGNCTLGVRDRTFAADVQTIPQGAQLVVYTDGITQARSPHDEKFGITRLMQVLRATDVRSAARTLDLVGKTVEDFRQTRAQQDDITIFVLANSESPAGRADRSAPQAHS